MESKLERSVSYMESEPPGNQTNNIHYEANSTEKFKQYIEKAKQHSESSEDDNESINKKNQN
jgi:hypothetical protein